MNKLSKYAKQYATKYFGVANESVVIDAFKAGYRKAMEIHPPPTKKIFNEPTQKLVDDMKVLNGIPPYDGFNISMGDSYFAKDLSNKIAKAGCDWDEVEKEAIRQGRKEKCSWDK